MELLPNFVGKTLKEATNYCSNKNLKCESSSNDLNSVIVSQSISENSDISTIRGKTITFGIKEEKKPITTKPSLDDKEPDDSVSENDDVNENTSGDSSLEDKDTGNNDIPKEEDDKDNPKEDNENTPPKEENKEDAPSTDGDNNNDVGGNKNEEE